MKLTGIMAFAGALALAGAAAGFETRTGATGCGRMFVSWEGLEEGEFGRYELYCGAGDAPETGELERAEASLRIEGEGEAWRSFAHLEGLPEGTRCWARVKRTDAGGESEWGEAVEAETLERGTPEGARASYTRLPMFMYHHVLPRGLFPSGYDAGGWYSTANFERDLKYMKEHNMHTITTSDIIQGKLPKNPIMLTFDDGYKDFLQYAVPLLEKYGFTAVNALVTRKMGGQSTWAVPEWPLGTLMTWAQAKECLQRGMEMGGHTQYHVNLYTDASTLPQVAGCYNDLVANIGRQIYFCYPWGMGGHDYEAGKRAARDAGFKFATRTYPAGIGHTGSDLFFFPRQFANQSDSLRDFLVKGDFDNDGDGLKDYIEYDWGLNAAAKDSDGDGLTDLEEVKYGGDSTKYNPYHPTSNPKGTDLCATRADTDEDGLNDYEEVKVYKTNPLKADADGDGLKDGEEVKTYGTDPAVWDTDGDGMSDGDEVKKYGTDPKVRDGRRPRYGAVSFPGRVEAENFDFGGEGVSFHDTTAGNAGDGKWASDRVDVYSGGTKWAVGQTAAGEWLEYTVKVPEAGRWLLTLRTGAKGSGGRMRVLFGGTDKTGAVSIPDTGDWKTFKNVQTVAELKAGEQILRISMDTAGSGGQAGWIDYVDAARAYFGLTGSQREFGAGAYSSKEFGVTGNVPWKATSDVSWLTITKGASGTGAGTVVYNVAANGGADRSGTLRVSAGGVTAEYAVTQAGKGPAALGFASAERAFGKGAYSSKEIIVTGNVPWTVTSDAGWLKVKKGASGSGNGTVVYDVSANGGAARTGRLTASGEGLSAVFTVTQEGQGPAALGFASAERTFGKGAYSSKEIVVTGNVPWKVTSDAGWLTVRKGASGTGTGTVVYDVSANGGAARTGRLTASGNGLSAVFTVKQDGTGGGGGGEGLKLSATNRTFDRAAASWKELGVETKGSWTASSDAGWLTITRGASGSGNGTVYYGLTANTGGTRYGKITVTGGGTNAEFAVKQTGILGLGSTNRTLGAGAASWKEVAVEGSVKWTAASDVPWLKLQGTPSGNGNGTVYYSVTANTGATRIGRITVSGGGLSLKFELTQTGTKDARAWRRFVATGSEEETGTEFRANIDTDAEGALQVTWTPDLGTARVYRVWGKRSLTEGEWETPATAEHRYFRVEVEMPGD